MPTQHELVHLEAALGGFRDDLSINNRFGSFAASSIKDLCPQIKAFDHCVLSIALNPGMTGSILREKLELAPYTDAHRTALKVMIQKSMSLSRISSVTASQSGDQLRNALELFAKGLIQDVLKRDNRIRTFLVTVQSAYIGLIESRRSENMCPFPGRLQQRMDSIKFLDCVCQYLERLGERLYHHRQFIFETEVLVIADSILFHCNVGESYTLAEISKLPDKGYFDKTEILLGPIGHISQPERDQVVNACLKLMNSFDSLQDLFASFNPNDNSSLRKYVGELKDKYSDFSHTYSNIRTNYVPKV